MLLWHEPNPGGEISTASKVLHRGRECFYSHRGQRSHAWYGLKTPSEVGPLGLLLEFKRLRLDLGAQLGDGDQKFFAFLLNELDQSVVRLLKKFLDLRKMPNARRKNLTLLIENRSKRTDLLGALTNEAVARSEENGSGDLLFALRLDKSHLRALRRDDYRLSVRSIILLPLNERLHVSGRDHLHLMTHAADLTRPIMGASAGFKDNNAFGLLRHKLEELWPRQLLSELQFTSHIGSVELKDILCQINSDHRIKHPAVISVSWLFTTTSLAHCDAV